MNILVACEKSGVIRRAFRARGHNAWSCDLEPSEDNSPFHIRGDAIHAAYGQSWDILIANPECRYLCNSGVQWLSRLPKKPKPDVLYLDARRKAMIEACDFFAALYHAPIARKCLENSQMHVYAVDYLQSAWKIPTFTQAAQPYQYGHDASKKTCLWLQNLEPLQIPDQSLWFPPRLVTLDSGRIAKRWSNQSDKDGCDIKSPSAKRSADRARTFEGIAAQMATQWG
jgi:hypothetical protein